jgi:selenide, water dikinase
MKTTRLTDLAHGGGCGCKLAPSVLNRILANTPAAAPFANLLVGAETGDDAAVYRLSDRQAVVATTDFFLPIVDDPFEFGRIAAANALSDIYAMGGTPILALAILGMPVDKLPVEMVRQILAGGVAIATAANIPVAGGHSIDAPEPIYGLAAVGLIDPARVLRNSTARSGDTLILTKPLGIGIYSAALKRGELDEICYEEMLASTTQLNAVGAELPDLAGVHAVTDVTGFALLGHALEMCRGARLSLSIDFARLPLFDGALQLAQSGIGTGAAKRNWASYGTDVTLAADIASWQRDLLCDPQTNGGLLIACAPSTTPDVLKLLSARGFAHACAIGQFATGSAGVTVN